MLSQSVVSSVQGELETVTPRDRCSGAFGRSDGHPHCTPHCARANAQLLSTGKLLCAGMQSSESNPRYNGQALSMLWGAPLQKLHVLLLLLPESVFHVPGVISLHRGSSLPYRCSPGQPSHDARSSPASRQFLRYMPCAGRELLFLHRLRG